MGVVVFGIIVSISGILSIVYGTKNAGGESEHKKAIWCGVLVLLFGIGLIIGGIVIAVRQ